MRSRFTRAAVAVLCAGCFCLAAQNQSTPTAGSSSQAQYSKESDHASDNVTIVKFEIKPANIKRPGSADFNWMIRNKSDHSTTVTLTLITTGPCNYHRERSANLEVNPGAGYSDNFTIDAYFYESDCAGKYSFELRISSGEKLLHSAAAAANVL
jgi:hypothetical protein